MQHEVSSGILHRSLIGSVFLVVGFVAISRQQPCPEGRRSGQELMDVAMGREEGEDIRSGEVEGYGTPGVLRQVEQHCLAVSGGSNASHASPGTE